MIIILGLCLGKIPERTPYVTSPAFNKLRGPSSYMPRKQQRVRVTHARALTTRRARTSPHGTGSVSAFVPQDLFYIPDMPFRTDVLRGVQIPRVTHPLRC
jgi:hypothetical protein